MTRKNDPIILPEPIQTELDRWYVKIDRIGGGKDMARRKLYFAMVDKVIKLIRPHFPKRPLEYKKKDMYPIAGFQW